MWKKNSQHNMYSQKKIKKKHSGISGKFNISFFHYNVVPRPKKWMYWFSGTATLCQMLTIDKSYSHTEKGVNQFSFSIKLWKLIISHPKNLPALYILNFLAWEPTHYFIWSYKKGGVVTSKLVIKILCFKCHVTIIKFWCEERSQEKKQNNTNKNT